MEVELEIKEIIQRTHNVKSVRLAIEGEPDYKAGQFGRISLKTEKECERYLSLSSSPTEKGYIEITKKLTQSDFSKILNSLKPGESLKAQYPFGKFTLEGSGAKIAFLSGGIGITPIRSMCKYAVDKNLGVDIILLYANHSIKDVVFKEDFNQMQKQYPKLRVCHVLREPAPGFKYTAGLINTQVVKNEIPDFMERKIYLCGPPGMVEGMKKILESELKVPQENIVTENFQGY
ncbi:MAG: FAD-binding oxidoreductase [Candidatus Omnitrophota bacterium]